MLFYKKKIGASLTGFTLYIFTIYAAIYGFILFDEKLESYHLLGTLLVFIGVSIPMVDRDGMSYRIISKLVFPMSKQLLPIQKNIVSGGFESDLTIIPQYWKWFKPELVDYKFTDKGLIVEPTEESVWWKNKSCEAQDGLLATHAKEQQKKENGISSQSQFQKSRNSMGRYRRIDHPSLLMHVFFGRMPGT